MYISMCLYTIITTIIQKVINVLFVRENVDNFAWPLIDMLGQGILINRHVRSGCID